MSQQLLAVLPLSELLSANFTVRRIDRAREVEFNKALELNVDKILKGETLSIKSPLQLSDIDNVIKQLDEFDNSDGLSTTISELGHIEMETASSVLNLIEFLRDSLPRDQLISTSFGILTQSESSKSLRIQLLWKARVIENPLWILQLFSSQQLADVDVETIQTVYPEIYTDLVNMIIGKIVENHTPNSVLPRKFRLMMSVLLQEPVLDVRTLKAYQAEPKPAQANLNIGA